MNPPLIKGIIYIEDISGGFIMIKRLIPYNQDLFTSLLSVQTE